MASIKSGSLSASGNDVGDLVRLKAEVERLEVSTQETLLAQQAKHNLEVSSLKEQLEDSGMNFKNPERVEINSVVLLRNIANESKREPMKLARILRITESKDNAQRILMLEYNNIKKNKEGNWIGTPMMVERSINDVIPIGKAIDESLLNLGSNEIEIEVEDVECENVVQEDNINDKIEEITGSDEQIQNDDSTSEDYDLNDKQDNHKENNHTPVRKSERLRKRLVEINPEDIGENDNEKDKDYEI